MFLFEIKKYIVQNVINFSFGLRGDACILCMESALMSATNGSKH